MRPPQAETRPYSDLPDEILQAVLGRAVEVAEGVRGLLTRVDDQKDAVRAMLLAEGRLRQSKHLPTVPQPSVAAVDGGAAVEKSLGTDTALAIAVGIEA